MALNRRKSSKSTPNETKSETTKTNNTHTREGSKKDVEQLKKIREIRMTCLRTKMVEFGSQTELIVFSLSQKKRSWIIFMTQ